MSNKLQPVRGTKDLLADEFRKFKHVTDIAREVSGYYGFDEIAIPIFEFTEVFKRTLGEASDVVSKEMYTFEDKGGESITLRPEFTAGIARAFIANGLTQKLPLKLFSTGPLFRYERPQKGRQRQFHQINFEILGIKDPVADIELISMGSNILKELGVADKINLEINSLGDSESREKYRDKLVEYFSSYKNDLSEDSLKRLETNPLRILDSKDDGDKKLVAGAPVINNFYSDAAKDFFEKVQDGLIKLGVGFKVNDRLVRGLDYYCHTAFEFATDHLGSQNAVLAGGRYDGLIATMGGQDTPAVGFAGGVERLLALVDGDVARQRPVVILPIGDAATAEALLLSHVLRSEKIYTETILSGNVGKRMKKASNINASSAIIFGDDEMKNSSFKVKNFDSGKEEDVSADRLVDFIREN